MAKNIKITNEIHEFITTSGVDSQHVPGLYTLPCNAEFEPPCSIKRMICEMSLKMGAYSYAVSGYYFGVEIGRYCSIGEGVQIGRHSHPLDFGSTSPLFYTNKQNVLGTSVNHFGSDSDYLFKPNRAPTTFKPTKIGNDVYIGHDAFIMPGVVVGDGAIIGARSVVTKDIPKYAIAAGVPAKVIRKRFSQNIIDGLINSAWWEYSLHQLRGVQPDSPESFIEEAEKLLEKKIDGYKPKIISINQFT